VTRATLPSGMKVPDGEGGKEWIVKYDKLVLMSR
jgi:hypothetical protein